MELFWIIVLGALQGLTEFLPVSSSGHLAAGQMLMHKTGGALPNAAGSLTLEVLLHLATLGAVIVYFRRDLGRVLRSAWQLLTSLNDRRRLADLAQTPDGALTIGIVIGSIPTAILGLALRPIAIHVAHSGWLLGAVYLGLAALLTLSARLPQHERPLTVRRALIIGVVQGLAVLPGISRSGATIVAGLALGLSREQAVRFSFLLSLPAILGAALLEIDPASMTAENTSLYLSGALTAFGLGLASLVVLTRLVRRGRLWVFAPYAALFGIGCLALFG